MAPANKFTRSFVISAVAGWLIMIGTASVLAARDSFRRTGPYPWWVASSATSSPATTIAALQDAGYITIITGLVTVAIAALHRATHHRAVEQQPIRDQRIIFEDTASRPS